MTILMIGTNGEITLDDHMLRHLGVGPGDNVKVHLLPNGYLSIVAAEKKSAAAVQA